MFIPTGYGQATLVFTIPGPSSPAMITFGYTASLTQGVNNQAESIFDAWATAGALWTAQDAQTVLNEVRVLRRIASGELESGLHVEDRAGSQAGEGAPPQVALLIQKITGLAGRKNRGRMYVPGVIATTQGGGWGGTFISDTQGRANTFFTALGTASADMVILHNNQLDTPTPVTGLNVVALSATQRRRIR